MQKNPARPSFFRGRISTYVSIGVLLFVPVAPVMAQLTASQQQVNAIATASGVAAQQDLFTIIGRIINIVLSTFGVIFLVLMLYAGYMWMTSDGDADKVKKAQITIRNAVIGLLITASAWAITSFILSWLVGGLGGDLGAFTPGTRRPPGLPGSAGSLGAGIIESHLPERSATNVPRNTPIIITFKEAIKPDSFIADWSQNNANTGLNAEAVKVYRTRDGAATALTSDKVRVSFTEDKKTFVLRPVEPLGSPNAPVMYTVELKSGSNGIVRDDGRPAFGGSFGNGYVWQFEVSTQLDLTPPFVTSVVPSEGGQYSRNIIVQVNFNKAMDPTSVSGRTVNGFQNIEVLSGSAGQPATTPVAGEFRLSNKYQTVEFVPDSACGTNSCGRTIYCLPGDASIKVVVKAASLDATAPPPQALLTANGYDGAVSVVGNSLDGNKNGQGEGPTLDGFSWAFRATSDVRISAPVITATVPGSDTAQQRSNIPLDKPVVVTFDALLQSSTVNTANAKISAYGKDEAEPDTFWWSTGVQLLKEDGTPIDQAASPPDIAYRAAVQIFHRRFIKSGATVEENNYYDPYILSGIQDAYQNCYKPAGKCGSGVGSPNCCNSRPSTQQCQKTICANTPDTERCKQILK